MTYYILNIDGKLLVYTDPANAHFDAKKLGAEVTTVH